MISALTLAVAMIVPGESAYNFSQSIGVNIHIDRTDGQWPNYPFITAFLKSTNIHKIRSSLSILPGPNNVYANYLQGLDDLDKPDAIRSDEVVSQNFTAAQQIHNAATIWGIDFFEGPNELDVCCNDANWISDDKVTVAAMAAARATWFGGVSVVAPTVVMADPALLGNLSGQVQYGNEHDYTNAFIPETPGWGGDVYHNGTIYGSEAYNIAAAQRSAVGEPVISTEYGYSSAQLSETTQASYDERMTLVHAINGVTRQYLYDLVDDNQSYGLARLDGSLKPAAFGMQGLLAILGDSTPYSGTCSLSATITAATPVDSYVFCKANGEKDLVLWQPAQLQDPNTLASTPATPASVGVSVVTTGLTRVYSQTSAYNWLENDSPSIVNGVINAVVTERPLAIALNAGAPVTLPLLPSAK